MRLDKLLWFLRFAKTRGVAQGIVGQGHVRLNGRRVERMHQNIAVGDRLVLPLPGGVRVIELLAMPVRRGPADEAQSCYRVLDERAANPIAALENTTAAEGDLQP